MNMYNSINHMGRIEKARDNIFRRHIKTLNYEITSLQTDLSRANVMITLLIITCASLTLLLITSQ